MRIIKALEDGVISSFALSPSLSFIPKGALEKGCLRAARHLCQSSQVDSCFCKRLRPVEPKEGLGSLKHQDQGPQAEHP